MNKIRNILDFYVLTNSLKDKIRSGVSIWNIKAERLESIAEHVYGVCMLAIAIDSEYNFDIDIKRVVLMLAIHELEECIIGDLTPFDNVTNKKDLGRQAVSQILDGLLKKEEYIELTDEFNEKKSKDSKFANYCDKLEAMLQMKLYEDKGCSDLNSPENKKLVEQDWIQKLIDGGCKTIADLFFDYHLPSFEGDKVFESIALYAKDNSLVEK